MRRISSSKSGPRSPVSLLLPRSRSRPQRQECRAARGHGPAPHDHRRSPSEPIEQMP
ncbi:hypothetical protein EAS54_32775 [Bradyrhizobium guangzhouense]|nr:hypothetical protein EAS54_32775 [Bradyrhizobium guangzhouense]